MTQDRPGLAWPGVTIPLSRAFLSVPYEDIKGEGRSTHSSVGCGGRHLLISMSNKPTINDEQLLDFMHEVTKACAPFGEASVRFASVSADRKTFTLAITTNLALADEVLSPPVDRAFIEEMNDKWAAEATEEMNGMARVYADTPLLTFAGALIGVDQDKKKVKP